MLITGGAGFIGVNTAQRFLDTGWGVTVFDNFSRRGTEVNRAFLENKYGDRVKIVKGDVRTDQKLLNDLAEQHDVIIHLAAQVAVTTSVVNPREDFDINALGTFNVLEAVRMSKKKPMLLYASTNKVYGGLENLSVEEKEKRYVLGGHLPGVDEWQPLDFHSPYGCSKGTADQYVRDYARLYDLKTVVFRQSCIYGPHQLGIEDQGWVAWFLIAAMFGRPVTIYGNGKQVRDLLNVSDLTALYQKAIENPEKSAGAIYNTGGGPTNTLSLIEFLEFMKNDLGLTINSSSGDVRPGDQPIFISDNGKAEAELGWQPKIGVEQGIRELHAWLQEHKGELQQFYK